MPKTILVSVAATGVTPKSIDADLGDTLDFEPEGPSAPTSLIVAGPFSAGLSYRVPSKQVLDGSAGTYTLLAGHNKAILEVSPIRDLIEPKVVVNPRPGPGTGG